MDSLFSSLSKHFHDIIDANKPHLSFSPKLHFVKNSQINMLENSNPNFIGEHLIISNPKYQSFSLVHWKNIDILDC